MFRKVLFLAVIGLLFAAADLQADDPVDVAWDGGGDGSSWGDPYNWDPNIVPDNDGNTFAVGIYGGSGVEVALYQNRTISRLGCSGEVDLVTSCAPVQLTILGGLTNNGDLQIKIEIEGNVTNTAGAHLNLTDSDIDGTLYNLAGGRIDIEEQNHVNGVVENAGSITSSPASELNVEGENTFHNTGQLELFNAFCVAGGLFHNDSNGVITGSGLVYSATSIQNEGLISASGGSLLIVAENNATSNNGILRSEPGCFLHVKVFLGPSQADVNNTGRIEVNSGGGVTFYCNLLNQANGQIELLGGTLSATTITQMTGATFEGFGGITGDILIESGAKIELTGPTNIVGNVNIPLGAELEISDGQTLITGHTTCDGTIHLIGGTVIFQGGCDCEDCNIINEAGVDRNHFDLNADGVEDLKDLAYFAETWMWQATWY